MNTQRYIVSLGLVGLLAVFLFPPFEATYLTPSDNFTQHIGPYPIISPPPKSYCREVMFENQTGVDRRCLIGIDESRWALYFGLVIAVTAGLVFVTTGSIRMPAK